MQEKDERKEKASEKEKQKEERESKKAEKIAATKKYTCRPEKGTYTRSLCTVDK